MKNLYLIVGPSGCGKTTLVENLEKLYGLKPVESYTTRPPREEGEKGHIFVSDDEFDAAGKMVAYTVFNGFRYGVTKELLKNADTYVIDPDGVDFMRRNGFDKELGRKIIVIGLTCDVKTCAARMSARGDSMEKVTSRIEHDQAAFSNVIGICDFIVNTDLDPIDLADKVYAFMQEYEDGGLSYQALRDAVYSYATFDLNAAESGYVRDVLLEQCGLSEEQIGALGLGFLIPEEEEEE